MLLVDLLGLAKGAVTPQILNQFFISRLCRLWSRCEGQSNCSFSVNSILHIWTVLEDFGCTISYQAIPSFLGLNPAQTDWSQKKSEQSEFSSWCKISLHSAQIANLSQNGHRGWDFWNDVKAINNLFENICLHCTWSLHLSPDSAGAQCLLDKWQQPKSRPITWLCVQTDNHSALFTARVW